MKQMGRHRAVTRQRQIELALELQSLATKALAEYQEKMSRREPLNLNPDEIIALVKLGSELDAEALGLERENH
jgi:hypothetical protein